MSALPKAIQRQVDEAAAAEAAIAQELAQTAEVFVSDPTQLAPANAEPAVSPQNVAPAPAPVAEAPPPAPSPADDWQQKYRSLQGMFAHEFGELRGQLKRFGDQNLQLQQQIAAMTTAKPQEEPRPKVNVDPADEETFGADEVAMVQKYSELVFQNRAAPFVQSVEALDGRLKALEGMVTGVKEDNARSLENQYFDTLDKLVPDWKITNEDPRWREWLGARDPVYGVPRQDALNFARNSFDVRRTADIFTAFKAAQPNVAKPSLANQVAPNGASSPAPVAAPNKPIITKAFQDKFDADCRRGLYDRRPEEYARIQAEIDAATLEHRIR